MWPKGDGINQPGNPHMRIPGLTDAQTTVLGCIIVIALCAGCWAWAFRAVHGKGLEK